MVTTKDNSYKLRRLQASIAMAKYKEQNDAHRAEKQRHEIAKQMINKQLKENQSKLNLDGHAAWFAKKYNLLKKKK